MKKLNVRTYRLHRLVDYIGVIFLIALLMFIWQLYRGPIAIPFLKPYIIKALNHDDAQYQVTLDSVNLELVRSIKPLRIIANNVVYRKNNDEIIINAPKTSVSFSIKALMRGVIAPSNIEVENPSVYIFTTYGISQENKKEANQKKLEYYFDGMEEFLERFNSEENIYPESYINTIDIHHAQVEFHEVDLGQKWVLSDVNYSFDRNLAGMSSDVNALVKFNDREASSLGLELDYNSFKNQVDAEFYFSDLIPANLLDMIIPSEKKRDFYRIDIPTSGRIDTSIDVAEVVKYRKDLIKNINKLVKKISFDFEGGNGKIVFDKDEAFKVSSVNFKGDIEGDLDTINVKNAKAVLDGQTAGLSLQASGLKKLFFNSSMEDLKIELNASVDNLKINDLYSYWPRFIAPKAWDWCKESLFDGIIQDAKFSFNFGYDKQQKVFGFEGLSGSSLVSGASLDYLTGMPRITDIKGKVNFYTDKLVIDFDKGMSDSVILNAGTVELYDLDKEDNFAKINLQAVGSITDILKLIDHKPLEYTSYMGINPDSIKGTAQTDLALDFEMKSDLTPEEVKVNIKSKLSDVILPEMIEGKSIEAKKLDLLVTNNNLLITGVTNFEGIPVNLLWDESFSGKKYKSKYQLSFNFDANLKEKLGIDFSMLSSPYIQGSIPSVAIITTYDDDRIDVDVKGNLRTSSIDYSFLGFKKNEGIDGTVTAKLNFAKGQIKEIPSFSISKPDFDFTGKVSFYDDGTPKQINIFKINGPKTSANAQIELFKNPEKAKITVSGNSYNLSDFFARDDEAIKKAKEKRKKLKQEGITEVEDDWLENVMTTDINIAVNKLWTNDNIAIRNFAGSAKIINQIGMHDLHIVGNFDSSKNKKQMSRIKLDYDSRPDNEYVLNIESNDAGSTFKFLRLYDNMSGGNLSINARRTADKKFIGHAKIRDFSIHNTPILTKLFTVASFRGMVDLLTGEGLVFSHFDAPFEYQKKVLSVKDARAFGNVVGITASGRYSTLYQEYDVKGVIAPAYGLNTFIGSIPVVGNLLSGKDGTVFAANYKITGDIDDPKISINPLSALSPNSLKEQIASIFGSEDE